VIDPKNVKGEPDLQRNSDGVALIGDPRNDENIIVGQLQLTWLRFHNKVVDKVSVDKTVAEEPLRGRPAARPLALPVADPERLPAPRGRAGPAQKTRQTD
jgi:hypothetical protein